MEPIIDLRRFGYYACSNCHFCYQREADSKPKCPNCNQPLIKVKPPPDGRCSWNSIKNQLVWSVS